MVKRSYLELLQEVPSDEILNSLEKAFAKWSDETYEMIDENDQERFLGTDYQELAEMFITEVINGTSGCNWYIGEEFEDFELNNECEEYLAEFARSREFIYTIREHMHKLFESVA